MFTSASWQGCCASSASIPYTGIIFTKHELVSASNEEDRVLLSRDAGFAKQGPARYFIVADENPMVQLKEVVMRFSLKEQLLPFSRCLACNGILEMATKESIAYLLQQNTRQYYTEFWKCTDCGRVYWKGSHYERMLKTVEFITGL